MNAADRLKGLIRLFIKNSLVAAADIGRSVPQEGGLLVT